MTAPLPPLLLRGDCLVELRRIPDESVDSVICDPPYGLEFMGKAWDRYTPLDFELWCAKWAAECLRILKPGGHMLAFGGSRTWHRLAAGIEDAGFEIRDSIAWLYGSGFPKSMDVSKAIDKAAGATREVVGTAKRSENRSEGWDRPWMLERMEAIGGAGMAQHDVTAPATDAAREWEGWGTALKPAFEPVVVARKPLGEKTVAANVLAHGTGALNIDATRIETSDKLPGAGGDRVSDNEVYGKGLGVSSGRSAELGGRWPANVALDESQAAALDAQTGTTKSRPGKRNAPKDAGTFGAYAGDEPDRLGHSDGGGASRFFYVAKAPKSERPVYWRPSCNCADPAILSEWSETSVCANCGAPSRRESHATVKPLALMRWLCRLVTPPGGVVVDPFAGSGTTLEAAYLEGFEAIGVEMTPEYWPLVAARIERVTR